MYVVNSRHIDKIVTLWDNECKARENVFCSVGNRKHKKQFNWRYGEDMHIIKIIDYDEFSQEGDVIVTDGKFEILCLALHPFSGDINAEFRLSPSPVGTSDIMTAENDECVVKKLDTDRYSYFLQGKVVDVENGKVEIGGLLIEDVGYIPKDIKNGEIVEFRVSRIDLLEK